MDWPFVQGVFLPVVQDSGLTLQEFFTLFKNVNKIVFKLKNRLRTGLISQHPTYKCCREIQLHI